MSTENVVLASEIAEIEVPEISGAKIMADAVIRLLDAYIRATGNLSTVETLSKLKKEVSKMRKQAAAGQINNVTEDWRL